MSKVQRISIRTDRSPAWFCSYRDLVGSIRYTHDGFPSRTMFMAHGHVPGSEEERERKSVPSPFHSRIAIIKASLNGLWAWSAIFRIGMTQAKIPTPTPDDGDPPDPSCKFDIVKIGKEGGRRKFASTSVTVQGISLAAKPWAQRR